MWREVTPATRLSRRPWTMPVAQAPTATPSNQTDSASSQTPSKLTPPTPSTASTSAPHVPLAPVTSPAPPPLPRPIPVRTLPIISFITFYLTIFIFTYFHSLVHSFVSARRLWILCLPNLSQVYIHTSTLFTFSTPLNCAALS